MLTLVPGMRARTIVFITMLALCHLQIRGQALTNAAPPPAQEPAISRSLQRPLPDDPGQEMLPVAQPEPEAASGVPVEWEAKQQSRVGDTWTLSGDVVVHYRDYTLKADKVVYHQSTTELEADGNLQVAGGPNDVMIYASRGDMRLNMHTARFYNVHGSQGVRRLGRTSVYSTTNPFLFSGRVLLQTGEGRYSIIDGTMTNCRLPRPDWQLFSRTIKLENGTASSANMLFKLLGVPVFYLPYLRHPVDDLGRESGFLIPVVSTGSSIKGYTFGEQFYWAINRSMDMVAGSEYYSKRGWAPNGDFRYKGPGLDHLTVRLNALFDRGFVPAPTSPPAANCLPHPTSTGACQPGRHGHQCGGPQGSHSRNAHCRQRRIPLVLRLPAGLQRQLLAGGQLRGAEQRLAHPRAQWLRAVGLARSFRGLRQLGQRRRGEDSSSAQPALRCAGPPAWRLNALLGHGIVARLSDPRRACRHPRGNQFSRSQHRPLRHLSASRIAAGRRRLERAGPRPHCARQPIRSARIPT